MPRTECEHHPEAVCIALSRLTVCKLSNRPLLKRVSSYIVSPGRQGQSNHLICFLHFHAQGEYGPFWFLSKDRIDPESLGFKDGEAAYLWIEYWIGAALAATWVWVMFVDKDQKTERYWDVRAVKEFRRQFQGVSRSQFDF